MQHKGTKQLETSRLILRPFIKEDASSMYHNWASNEEVTKYLMWPVHKDISVSQSILNDWIPNYQNPTYYHWAIILKDHGNDPIGCIGVNNTINNTLKMAHIGYCIGQNWWHQGITSEALKSVITYLFTEVGLNRIESRHDPRNPNSGAVMKKCGMQYEGTLRQSDWNNQGVCDASYYSILLEDFLASKN